MVVMDGDGLQRSPAKNRKLKCKNEDDSNPGIGRHVNGDRSANASEGNTAQAFERR
ncbi:hypothetical protein TSUD_288220 [Trifolium subterraneum]|uniref:Uncharacterized protein n=1 Tax=Trifolium subterraneum TaxID=3900 RepID=A0A2Z6NXS5_TRISU|nr:hypothetical protein TSUD_288220 [Trifolium subterraneum]